MYLTRCSLRNVLSCGNLPYCEEDLTLEDQMSFRFYDITVTATDASGRVGVDKTRIILVPECRQEGSATDVGHVCELREGTYYYIRDYISELADRSTQMYTIETMDLTWQYNMSHIDTAPPTLSPAPSSVPSSEPSLEPTQSPSAGPSLVPSSSPSLQPSMEPSSSPSSLPSLVPSSEPSLKPSMTPSTEPSVIPSSVPTTTLNPSTIPSRGKGKGGKGKEATKGPSKAGSTKAPKAASCSDDPNFLFKDNKSTDNQKTRSCKWLSMGENPAGRTERYCKKKRKVGKYCKKTCGACDESVSVEEEEE